MNVWTHIKWNGVCNRKLLINDWFNWNNNISNNNKWTQMFYSTIAFFTYNQVIIGMLFMIYLVGIGDTAKSIWLHLLRLKLLVSIIKQLWKLNYNLYIAAAPQISSCSFVQFHSDSMAPHRPGEMWPLLGMECKEWTHPTSNNFKLTWSSWFEISQTIFGEAILMWLSPNQRKNNVYLIKFNGWQTKFMNTTYFGSDLASV